MCLIGPAVTLLKTHNSALCMFCTDSHRSWACPESPLVVYVGYHCHVVQTDQDVVASQIWQEGFECQKNCHLL